MPEDYDESCGEIGSLGISYGLIGFEFNINESNIYILICISIY